MESWTDGARAFVESVISIFAIVNPLGNLPVFVGLSEDWTLAERRRMFHIAGVTSLLIVCSMALAGRVILRYVFHIDINEFMFGGGLILIVVGVLNIVRRGESSARKIMDAKARQVEQVSLAVSPIASPLLVGPGTIVTVMVLADRYGVLYSLAASVTAFAFVIVILHYANVIHRVMGRVGSRAMGRVMQVFIVAIGVHFVFRGLVNMFPMLAGK